MVSNNHMANNGITATLSLPQLLSGGMRKNKLNLECKYLMISSVFSIQYSIFNICDIQYSIFVALSVSWCLLLVVLQLIEPNKCFNLQIPNSFSGTSGESVKVAYIIIMYTEDTTIFIALID